MILKFENVTDYFMNAISYLNQVRGFVSLKMLQTKTRKFFQNKLCQSNNLHNPPNDYEIQSLLVYRPIVVLQIFTSTKN